ncbi:transposase [uncultured Ilyobacter sp.]|uniref:IS91 family transposase n=1 Tax=uncultured Ilyobacter sp. TaxID=544433 RepID=UPI0029C93910|nr:transposase [uncultured Ilyobacter sp.]
MAIKITDIFTKSNTERLFKEKHDFFKHFHKDHIEFIKKSIDNARLYCDLSYAKAIFKCPICGELDYRPVSCKSKFCSSCGKLYAEKWALKLSQDMIDQKHRHILFTFPDFLWKYFLAKRHGLTLLSNHINQLFKEWFKKHKIRYYGLVIAIHSFGRDSSFHTHFHVIISLGGFKEDFTWKKLEYFEPKFFNSSWRFLVLQTIKSLYPNSKKAMKAISTAYFKEFYVALKGQPIKKNLKYIEYIGRYLMRPAIAEYRITHYDGKHVTFWYTDTNTQKKITLTLSTIEFMTRLVLHIHPKNFKAIRRFGFYARNINSSLKDTISLFKRKFLFKRKLPTWAERLFAQYGKVKLICPNWIRGNKVKTE